MTILVIDDAAIMRIVIKDILVRHCKLNKGDILEAKGGISGIEMYKKDKPTLVICDISMPDLSGIDVVKELVAFDPEAKIIMCTASGERAKVSECIRAGAKDYIVKPPMPERVIQAIENITGESLSGDDDDDDEIQDEYVSLDKKSGDAETEEKKEEETPAEDESPAEEAE